MGQGENILQGKSYKVHHFVRIFALLINKLKNPLVALKGVIN